MTKPALTQIQVGALMLINVDYNLILWDDLHLLVGMYNENEIL